MAFTYESRQEAIEAAVAAGVAEDQVTRDHDGNGLWGWVEAESDPADRVPQSGDVILQIDGPNLKDHQLALAVQFAKKLGLTITLRDAVTFEPVHKVRASEVKGQKGSRSDGPTARQICMFELASRDEGVTSDELIAEFERRGLMGELKRNQIGWAQMFDQVAEKFAVECVHTAVYGRNAKGRRQMITHYKLRQPEGMAQAA